MRAFIIFALFTVANADVGGYTYGIAAKSGFISGGGNGAESKRYEAISGVNGGPAGGLFDGSFVGLASGSNGGSTGSLAASSSDFFRKSFGGSAGGSLADQSFGSIRSSLGGSATRNFDAGFGAASNSAPLIDNGYNKEFFTFSAPESEFAASTPVGEVAQSLRKNLRVIFIRAPEYHGVHHAALNLAKEAVEQKTAIYVLTKQADVSELANSLQQINSNINNKPEVHFVKYRTPEDAANAQHAIQQQYDNLGGSSYSHDGGVAPVLNFASKGSAYSGGASYGIETGSSGAITSNSSPSASYLPIPKL